MQRIGTPEIDEDCQDLAAVLREYKAHPYTEDNQPPAHLSQYSTKAVAKIRAKMRSNEPLAKEEIEVINIRTKIEDKRRKVITSEESREDVRSACNELERDPPADLDRLPATEVAKIMIGLQGELITQNTRRDSEATLLCESSLHNVQQ